MENNGRYQKKALNMTVLLVLVNVIVFLVLSIQVNKR